MCVCDIEVGVRLWIGFCVCALVSECEKTPSFIDFPRGCVYTFLSFRWVSSFIDSLRDRREDRYVYVCKFTYVCLQLHMYIHDHITCLVSYISRRSVCAYECVCIYTYLPCRSVSSSRDYPNDGR